MKAKDALPSIQITGRHSHIYLKAQETVRAFAVHCPSPIIPARKVTYLSRESPSTMCHTVVKATVNCKFGHMVDAEACWRQCAKASLESQASGKWNNICRKLKDRQDNYLLVLGGAAVDRSAHLPCKACRKLRELPEYNKLAYE